MKFPGFTVGVTGGIGSGKSAVCEILSGFGRVVIAADPLARDIMESDERVKRRLMKLLGEDAYAPDGRLERGRVASMIFGDRLLRQKVNDIVHPRVLMAIEERLSELGEARRSPYAVVEAALIYESGLDKLLDVVVVVDAELETRLQRVMNRDGLTREDVLKRARAQMSVSEKVRKADFLIRNSRERSSLAEKVRFVDGILSRLAQGN